MGAKSKKGAVLGQAVVEEEAAAYPLNVFQVSEKKKMKKRKELGGTVTEEPTLTPKTKKKKASKESNSGESERFDGFEKPAKKKKKDKNPEKESSEAVVIRENGENQKLCVSVSGHGSEDPKFRKLENFELDGVPANVLECCKKFERPSPIQSHAWPFLLAGRDFIGIAATGSG